MHFLITSFVILFLQRVVGNSLAMAPKVIRRTMHIPFHRGVLAEHGYLRSLRIYGRVPDVNIRRGPHAMHIARHLALLPERERLKHVDRIMRIAPPCVISTIADEYQRAIQQVTYDQAVHDGFAVTPGGVLVAVRYRDIVIN